MNRDAVWLDRRPWTTVAALLLSGCLPKVEFTSCAESGRCSARDAVEAGDARDATVDDLAEATPVDVLDVFDARDATDALDATDASDDLADALDAVEVGDADRNDASDAVEAGADVVDVADVSVDVAADVLRCDAGASVVDGACSVIAAPRPIAPLSTSTVTSQTPRLRWELRPGTDGARIELCRERACATVVHRFEAAGSMTVTPMTLTPGVWFWRVAGTRAGDVGTSHGPTWQFVVGHGSAAVNTSWGSSVDFNGDGDCDLTFAVRATVYVYYGTGSGLAATSVSINVEPATVTALSGVGCDVNGDGFGDLALTIRSSGATTSVGAVYLGGPSGLSRTPLRAFDPIVTEARLVGDVNGDGYGDLAFDDYVAFGAEGGPVDGRTTLPSPSAPSIVPAGDINGDGFADVRSCAAHPTRRLWYVCAARVGDSSRRLMSFGSPVEVLGGVATLDDRDGDGRTDAAGLAASGVTFIPNIYYGGVFDVSAQYFSRTSLLTSLGDVDADGFADAFEWQIGGDAGTTQQPYFDRGGSSRAMDARQAFVAPPMFVTATSARLGDIDRDGRADFAIADRSSQVVEVFRATDFLASWSSSRTIRTPADAASYGIVMNY